MIFSTARSLPEATTTFGENQAWANVGLGLGIALGNGMMRNQQEPPLAPLIKEINNKSNGDLNTSPPGFGVWVNNSQTAISHDQTDTGRGTGVRVGDAGGWGARRRA